MSVASPNKNILPVDHATQCNIKCTNIRAYKSKIVKKDYQIELYGLIEFDREVSVPKTFMLQCMYSDNLPL